VSMMEHSGADGDPPLNGYEPNVLTEGPDGVDEDPTPDDNPGSSDSDDKLTEYMWKYELTIANRVKLEKESLGWVDKAISGLRKECSKSCTVITQ